MPDVFLCDSTVARLQKIAVPLTDTFDTVVGHLLDAFEARQTAPASVFSPTAPGQPIKDDGGAMLFDWRNPPVLAHTTVMQAVLNGEMLPKGETYWNSIMYAVIRAAHKHGMTTKELDKELTVNHRVGMNTDNGYKFMGDIGLSVQGQNSDYAFRQAFALAARMKFKLEVIFRWQSKGEAAHPNRTGAFKL